MQTRQTLAFTCALIRVGSARDSNTPAYFKVAPLYPVLKSKEVWGRTYRRESETEPGVISEEKNVVDLSPALLSHQKVDCRRLKRERFSRLLRQSLESTPLR